MKKKKYYYVFQLDDRGEYEQLSVGLSLRNARKFLEMTIGSSDNPSTHYSIWTRIQ